jgi:hypothetical protein
MKLRNCALLAIALSPFFLLFGAEKTMTGKITDNMCDKDHSMMAVKGKEPDAKKCTLECVKDGMKFVFVTDQGVYEIQNQDLPELKTYAGDSVTLTGDLQSDGKTLKVDKLAPAK